MITLLRTQFMSNLKKYSFSWHRNSALIIVLGVIMVFFKTYKKIAIVRLTLETRSCPMLVALIVHGIVVLWILYCLRHWSIDPHCPVDEIAPNVSGAGSSRDCSHVDCVLFETLINRSLLSCWHSKRDRAQC